MDAGAYQSSPPARESNTFPAMVVVLLLVVAAAFSANRKQVTTGFDELAHASYVAQLQRAGTFWPDLESLRLLDPKTFAFTAKASYLNHPPLYYHLIWPDLCRHGGGPDTRFLRKPEVGQSSKYNFYESQVRMNQEHRCNFKETERRNGAWDCSAKRAWRQPRCIWSLASQEYFIRLLHF